VLQFGREHLALNSFREVDRTIRDAGASGRLLQRWHGPTNRVSGSVFGAPDPATRMRVRTVVVPAPTGQSELTPGAKRPAGRWRFSFTSADARRAAAPTAHPVLRRADGDVCGG